MAEKNTTSQRNWDSSARGQRCARRSLVTDPREMEYQGSPKHLRSHLHRYATIIVGVPHPYLAFAFLWTTERLSGDAHSLERAVRSFDLLASFDIDLHFRGFTSIVYRKQEFLPNSQRLRSDVVHGRNHVGDAAGDIVLLVFFVVSAQVFLVEHALPAVVVITHTRLNSPEALFGVFGQRKRAIVFWVE